MLLGLFIGVLDAAVSAPPLRAQFTSFQAWLEFTARLGLLPVLPLLLWSLVSTALGALLTAVARCLPFVKKRRILAWLWALCATPYIAWICTELFAGPRAQRLPGRPFFTVLAFGLGLLGVRAAAEVFVQIRDGVRGRAGRGLFAAGLGLLFVAGMYQVDRLVLPRLYPWFHLSLKLLTVFLAQAAVLWLLAGFFAPRSRPRIRRFASLGVVMLGVLLSLSALGRLYRATVLRSLVLEHTSFAAQIMRPYAVFRARRQPLRSTVAKSDVAVLDVAPPPIYTGPRLSGRDVFLITVDALRQDRLNPQTMPFLSAQSQRGVVFTRAYTQVPHTSFAVATLLTGKPIYALSTLGHEAASHETLPLVLRRFRYKTAAFYPPAVFFIEHERLKRLEESAYGFEYVKYEYLPAPRRTEQVMAFLEAEHPARAFVWIHYFEPHEPYELHAESINSGAPSSDKDRYDGEVRFIDQEIKRLCTYLQRTRPGALLIVAADHGEEFSEHGGRYHGTSLYEEQVHVPLAFIDLSPTPLLPPRQFIQPVGLIDVAPTLLGLLDIERSARMRGRDLSAWLLAGNTELPHAPIFAEIGRQKMVVLDSQKLICDLSTDTCRLFDLARDPLEQQNAIGTAPSMARRLRGALDSFLDEARRYETALNTRASSEDEALARARLGDRGALPALVSLLTQGRASLHARQQALTLFAELVATAPLPPPFLPDPLHADPLLGRADTKALLQRLFDDAANSLAANQEQRRWAALSLVRLFPAMAAENESLIQTLTALLLDDTASANQRLCGALSLGALPACRVLGEAPSRAAAKSAPLSIDCVKLWTQVLPAAMAQDDPDAIRPLLQLLGHSRDGRALSPLLQQLDSVRSRADVVMALAALGNPGAIAALEQRLVADPYVHVRAAAAAALGVIGGEGARAALHGAAQKEQEAPVRAAIRKALDDLAAPAFTGSPR